jgi:acetyl esterase/lipase
MSLRVRSRWIAAALAAVASPLIAQPLPSGVTASGDAQPPDQNTALRGLEAMTRQATERLAAANATAELRGSGPFPATLEVDLALPNATIYRPADLQRLGRRKLGLMIWGNGGCTNDGASARAHLAEVASHGYLVIAPGKPLTGPATLSGAVKPLPMTSTIADLRSALDWALNENSRPGSLFYRRIDPAAVAASGHSCGGMQAILLGDDPRIATVIVHNSGVASGDSVLPDHPPLLMHEERLKGLRRPVLLVLGGPSEVMWAPGNNVFDKLKAPVVLASANVGHGGTFAEPHGGKAAQIAVDWLEWQLRGQREASATFLGVACKLCREPGWTIRKKGVR